MDRSSMLARHTMRTLPVATARSSPTHGTRGTSGVEPRLWGAGSHRDLRRRRPYADKGASGAAPTQLSATPAGAESEVFGCGPGCGHGTVDPGGWAGSRRLRRCWPSREGSHAGGQRPPHLDIEGIEYVMRQAMSVAKAQGLTIAPGGFGPRERSSRQLKPCSRGGPGRIWCMPVPWRAGR